MKYYSKIIAVLALMSFATTFVALESHGSSLCSAPEISHQVSIDPSASAQLDRAADHQPATDHSSSQGCHCTHSANCSLVMGDAPSVLHFQNCIGHILVQDEEYAFLSNSLIKPPRI